MAFALSQTLAPTSGTISPKTSGTLLLSLPSKVNSRHFSSQNISVKPHCPSLPSVCSVCVCVCVRVRVHLLHNYAWTLVDKKKKRITFPISLYIMCVCLFSALSFTNFHYYYCIVTEFCQTRRSRSPSFLLLLSLKRILQFHSDLVFTLAAK